MRKTLPGEKQFTASVWLLTKTKPQKTLLVHHKKFNMWCQPGGHIEPFENPVEAAIRETKEETGVDISFLKDKVDTSDPETAFMPSPDYFLEETIPAYKTEPAHFHLDFMYVVEVEEQAIAFNKKESHEIGWFTRQEVLKLPIFENTRRIVSELLKK